MRLIGLTLAAAAFALLGGAAFAQDAMTATCKDGTTWIGARRAGACRGHQGVQAFGAVAATGGATPVAAPPAPAPAAMQAAPLAPAPSPGVASPAPMAAAPGGGSGQVWVNGASKVYHCPGDRYYGKTKSGGYMAEAAARAAGGHPSHGKACS